MATRVRSLVAFSCIAGSVRILHLCKSEFVGPRVVIAAQWLKFFCHILVQVNDEAILGRIDT
jgi:hypothetical protein